MINSIRDYDVEAPILLNCWKHHKDFIQTQILKVAKGREETLQKLPSQLSRIGDSLLDLYSGLLKPYDISILIKSELKKRNVFTKKSFEEWVKNSDNNYQIIYLPDGSYWTIRKGQHERYIHIHPCRYSPHTIRIRALTLKTAIVVLAWAELYCEPPLSVSVINYVRTELLNTSPIKTISKKDGLGKVISLLAT
jgi:hypothetical protein